MLVEIGCGTGLNLVHFLETYPSKSALGLDWSVNAVKIIDKLGGRFPGRITGKQFDMFHPPSTEDFKNILPRREVRIGVLTVGALEQLGVGYARMLDFLKTIANTFNVEKILHMETAFELYDKNVLFDLIPVKYIEKHNWLRGYYNDLKMMANQGEVSVVEMKKTFGSFFHDGYTVTVWNGVR